MKCPCCGTEKILDFIQESHTVIRPFAFWKANKIVYHIKCVKCGCKFNYEK